MTERYLVQNSHTGRYLTVSYDTVAGDIHGETGERVKATAVSKREADRLAAYENEYEPGKPWIVVPQ